MFGLIAMGYILSLMNTSTLEYKQKYETFRKNMEKINLNKTKYKEFKDIEFSTLDIS